jgi:hypothetical protein
MIRPSVRLRWFCCLYLASLIGFALLMLLIKSVLRLVT